MVDFRHRTTRWRRQTTLGLQWSVNLEDKLQVCSEDQTVSSHDQPKKKKIPTDAQSTQMKIAYNHLTVSPEKNQSLSPHLIECFNLNSILTAVNISEKNVSLVTKMRNVKVQIYSVPSS